MTGRFLPPQEPTREPSLKLVASIGSDHVAWDMTPAPGEKHVVTIETQRLEDGSLYINHVSINVSVV